MKLLYKNILEVSHRGLRDESGDLLTIGDGTAYVTGSSATVDVDNRQFDLTTLTSIADLTEADDFVNSFILFFPATGNIYHITDFVASTDVVQVFETPDTNDTADWEIRRALDEENSAMANPPHYMQNNENLRQWKGSAATAQELYAMLPNYVLDGGFEEQAAGNVGGDWSATTTNWQITATAPLLGSRMAVWDAAANSILEQDLTGKFEKDKTYTVLFKAQSVTGSTTSLGLDVIVRQNTSPSSHLDTAVFPSPFTITTTAAWFNVDFTPEFTTDGGQLLIRVWLAEKGSATAVHVDEVYIFEKLSPERLLVHNHNLNGSENILLRGAYCHPSRTSYSTTNDADDLVASFDQDGSEIVNKSWTAASYPVYHLSIPAESGKTHEAGLVGIYEELDLRDFKVGLGRGYTVGNVSLRTPKGITHNVHRQALKQNWNGSIRTITDAEKSGVNDWWAWIEAGNKPFWWEDYAGIVRLVEITRILSVKYNQNLIEDISFAFEEVDTFEG